MMNIENLILPEVQAFISENLESDLNKLILRKPPFPRIPMKDVVQQIIGRKTASKKFPFLLEKNIVFPPNINLEQASSEATAKYKAKNLSGKSFLDLTCGFGIDAYFLSRNFEEITLVEQNQELLDIVRHNWWLLGRKAAFVNEYLQDFLKKSNEKFDAVYLDPARRDLQNRKKFLLEDLSPNLLEIAPVLRNISDKIIVKLSPLIDISYLVSKIENIREIKIIAVKNEVKELLLEIDYDCKTSVKITCINLETFEPEFSFDLDEEKSAKAGYSEVLKYLYIPNNAVLKSGGFSILSEKFGVKKLHPNTHLYTSDVLIENFTGRILKVEKLYQKDMKKDEKFNIISKNHPLKPEEIKRKYKLQDGGDSYLIFTQSVAGKVLLRSV